MTCPSDNVLAELVDGSLADRDRGEVERHLDGCAACGELVAELAWVVKAARPAPTGYRFLRVIDDGVFEAIELAKNDRHVVVEIGAADPKLETVRHPAVAEVRVGDDHVITPLLETSVRAWAIGKSATEIVALWGELLGGLAALHRAGIVHGHVTPDRVFVVDGRPVLGGFARPLARTSGYLAAEVLEGKPASSGSDQVAACIALYELLAGTRPFTGATAGALAVAMTSPPEPATIDREIHAVLVRGLAPDPAQRWPDVGALAAALAAPPRRGSRLVVAAIAVLTLAIVVYAFVVR